MAKTGQFWQDLQNLKRQLAALRQCRWQLIVALFLGILSGVSSGFGIPILLKMIAQQVFNESQTLSMALLCFYCLLPAALVGTYTFASFFNNYLLQMVGQNLLLSLRLRIFEKIQRLSLSFFNRMPPGEIISKASNDASVIQMCLMSITRDIIKCPITLVSAFGAMIYICVRETDVWLLILILILIGLSAFPIRILGLRIRERNLRAQSETAALTVRLTQNLEAVQEIRAFGREKEEARRYLEVGQRLVNAYLKATWNYLIITPTIEMIAVLGIGVAMFYAYRVHIQGDTFLAIGMALYFSYDPIKSLGRMNGNIQCVFASLSRLESLLAEPETICDPQNPVDFPETVESIAFCDVSFEYDPGVPVLKHISLQLDPGKSYALVGPSGAGKTSLANLLLRFYDVSAGKISFNGIDLRCFRQKDLRQHISLVSQQPTLLNDTLRNNLLWGNPVASELQLQQAIAAANATEFVEKLENGLETLIGEDGNCLSGGQRQRIAIARAFLRDAPLLLLDEATSALDNRSEAAINLALRRLFQHRTVLLISHRFHLLPHVDEIFVLHRGKIVQRGNHGQLLAQDGLYKELYLTHHLVNETQ